MASVETTAMTDFACAACRWRSTIVTSVATHDEYFAHAVEMARTASAVGVAACVCMVLSSAVSSVESNPLVRELRLPWSSTWRPPPTWCTQKLSGWRHAGILKTHALHHLGAHRWDVLFVDTDWRFVANPLPTITTLGRDIVAARDQTRHMLNVGVLWIRATPETLAVAWRTMNRTIVAWDQAIFTEEAGASSASCCWADTGRHLVHPHVSLEAKLHLRGSRQDCVSPHRTYKPSLVLAPPTAMQTSKRMYPKWTPARYNKLEKAFYRWKCYECDNKCTRTYCALDGTNVTQPIAPKPRGSGLARDHTAHTAKLLTERMARRRTEKRLVQARSRSESTRCASANSGCCVRHPRALGCEDASLVGSAGRRSNTDMHSP
jgi:hypothetical protein